MSQYRAPLAEMQFVMNELAGLPDLASLPGFEDATPDTVAAILEEAGKFASDVLDPLNRGDGDAGFLHAKIATARHFADHCLTQAPGLRDTVVAGAAGVLAFAEDHF